MVPFGGMGEAPQAGDGKVPGRRQALLRARHAALEGALGTILVPIDDEARKAVLSQVEAWTGAYRIVEEKTDGATVTVKVEVELDIGRLRKRVAKQDAAQIQTGFRLTTVEGKGACKSLDEARVSDVLAGAGVLGSTKAAEPLALEVNCRELGKVPYTHAFAARTDVLARGSSGQLARVSAAGFGSAPDQAVEVALQDAITQTAEQLVPRARGGVVLRVEQPWPASRVRQLERGLRESVLGVTRVELVGVDGDGAVRLHIGGKLAPQQLAERLEALELPGFALAGFTVDSPHALTVRMVD